MTSAPTLSPVSVRRLLLVVLFSRTIIDTIFRAVYPFLPFIAADLGVTVESAAQIVQTRNLVGIAAPFFGPWSDRYGRRAMMLIGMSLIAIASLALLLVSPLLLVIALMTVIGFGSIIFIPAQQAYMGDTVPYARRGRVMALAELAWSASAIIGLPLVGILVQTAGWRVAFVGLGLAGIGALFMIRFVLPPSSHVTHALGVTWLKSLSVALRAPGAAAAVSVIFLLAVTNENVNIVFGAWMKNTFLLDAVALGLVAASIGGAELVGEIFAAVYVDRLGKWRVVAVSLVLGAIAYTALPFLNANAWLGTLGLVLVYLAFEVGIVALLPLMTELAPEARATLLSLEVAAFSLGRALGAFTGPTLFGNYGFLLTSVASGVGVLLAFALWRAFVRERH